MNTYIPEGYKSLLGVYDTQKAIGLLKRLFEDQLAAKLNLFRVSAPLFLEEASGLNDNLNGYERPVLFDIPQAGKEAQVVQSLAKWKRMALHRYDFYPGKGLYTDMNAIRRDEDVLDNLHSVYVDQWDWEKIIESSDRNLDYLKSTVMDIVAAVCDTQRTMRAIYPQLQVLPELERQVTFVTAQELEDRYPDLTPKEREHAFVREHHTTFIIGLPFPFSILRVRPFKAAVIAYGHALVTQNVNICAPTFGAYRYLFLVHSSLCRFFRQKQRHPVCRCAEIPYPVFILYGFTTFRSHVFLGVRPTHGTVTLVPFGRFAGMAYIVFLGHVKRPVLPASPCRITGSFFLERSTFLGKFHECI